MLGKHRQKECSIIFQSFILLLGLLVGFAEAVSVEEDLTLTYQQKLALDKVRLRTRADNFSV